MNILFTVCGRAGSKGLKNKNVKQLLGIPLVYYTLASIKRYCEMHPEDRIKIALNTDSVALIELVQKQKIVPVITIHRNDDLAGDSVAKVQVIKDTFMQIGDNKMDVIIDLDITSPIRRATDIENIIKEYQKGIYDLVVSVVDSRRNPYFNMVERKENGFYQKICNSPFTARQQAPETYELNASIYAYSPRFLECDINKTILEYKCGISVMNDYLVLDIDSEEDYRLLSFLFNYFCEEDYEIKKVYDISCSMND